MTMKAQRLIAALEAAKRIAERAKDLDAERAKVEAGGYVEVLLGSNIGQALVQQWVRDLKTQLKVAEESHERVAGRLRRLRDVLQPACSGAPESDGRKSLVNELQSLDEKLRAQRFEPRHTELDAFSMLPECFSHYAAVVEGCLSFLKEHSMLIDGTSIASVLREAHESGDVSSEALQDILASLAGKRENLAKFHEKGPEDAELFAAVEKLKSVPLDSLTDAIEYVLELYPRLSASHARLSIRSIGSSPQGEILRLLGGVHAIAHRKSSLASIERHPWYAFARLLTLSRYSGFELKSDGENVLASVVRYLMKKSPDDVHATHLLLEIEKVHLHVMLDIDHGRAIQADLLRYRQRAEWYDTSLASILGEAEAAAGDKLVAREKIAVRHLATWLFDQGYVPFSQALGRGETDLQGADPRGAFVIEAKIITERTLPKLQDTLDKDCRDWANQALTYAEGLGLDRAYIVIFNRTASSQLNAGEPVVVGRVSLHFEVVSVTENPPSKTHGQTLTLRWTPPQTASSTTSGPT
jgi:hypothetical protein